MILNLELNVEYNLDIPIVSLMHEDESQLNLMLTCCFLECLNNKSPEYGIKFEFDFESVIESCLHLWNLICLFPVAFSNV